MGARASGLAWAASTAAGRRCSVGAQGTRREAVEACIADVLN